MNRRVFYEFCIVVAAHGNNNMFSQWTFYCHLNTRFCFSVALDYIIDLFDLVGTNGWECFFDFDDFKHADILFQSLCIQFLRLFRVVNQFSVLEVFGDMVDLLLRFGGNGRGNSFNTH